MGFLYKLASDNRLKIKTAPILHIHTVLPEKYHTENIKKKKMLKNDCTVHIIC